MRAATRRWVRSRVGQCCEYCRLHEDDVPLFPFHVEHIVPKKRGGTDNAVNLAWSCHHCNLAKSSNLSGRDRATGHIVVLFNPRRQRWKRHFGWRGPLLNGRTGCGRASIDVLNIKAPHRVNLRRLLIAGGLFPPD